MWARVSEILLGIGLLVSPWIFPGSDAYVWLNTLTGAGMIALGAMSYHPRFSWAHFLEIPLALWLILHAYLVAPWPAPPCVESNVFIGWTILIFAIIPNRALDPPGPWQKVLRAQVNVNNHEGEKI